MATSSRKKKAIRLSVTDHIVDEAVRLGERNGWHNVRLSDIAKNLKISLPDVLEHYRDLDAIANAFFARALIAMAAAPNSRFTVLSPRERIEILLLAWLDHVASHRALVVEMLQAKLWLFHPHHWVPMVFDLSRLIQLLRDVAGLKAAGRRKQIEEIGLTLMFLATLAVWSRDETSNQARTRRFLARRLDRADKMMGRFF